MLLIAFLRTLRPLIIVSVYPAAHKPKALRCGQYVACHAALRHCAAESRLIGAELPIEQRLLLR